MSKQTQIKQARRARSRRSCNWRSIHSLGPPDDWSFDWCPKSTCTATFDDRDGRPLDIIGTFDTTWSMSGR